MVKDVTTSQNPVAHSSAVPDARVQTNGPSDQSVPGQTDAATTGAVDVLDVTHAFLNHGTPLPVIDDVSLSVRPGTFVSLVGPSGSGPGAPSLLCEPANHSPFAGLAQR